MLLLAALALAASPPAAPVRAAGASARATASIRILSGVSIRWGEASPELPKLRQTFLRGAHGEVQPIRLVEFE